VGTRLRIENLHYDITETDLEELFSRIGPISNVSLVYDRAGRSEGVAYVTYNRYSDAKTAIAEFDGANAKGQPIRISITSSGPRRDRNPFDTAEKPRGSLFDRVERPRDARSLSPESRSESAEGAGRRRRRRGGGGGSYRRSDVSKPAPDHIDRYIPGQQAPARRTGGRRQGGEGRRGGNPRPKKTQEELDQEMEDYWGSNAAAETTEKAAAAEQTAAEPAPAASAAAAPAAAAPAVDDDIDMIE
jgi:THO complex subunit 4